MTFSSSSFIFWDNLSISPAWESNTLRDIFFTLRLSCLNISTISRKIFASAMPSGNDSSFEDLITLILLLVPLINWIAIGLV